MSETTTQKMSKFTTERMTNKMCSDVPGIGNAIAKELEDEAGFTKASHLLGQFLVFDQDEELFKDWLQKTASRANAKYRNDISSAMRQWTENFV